MVVKVCTINFNIDIFSDAIVIHCTQTLCQLFYLPPNILLHIAQGSILYGIILHGFNFFLVPSLVFLAGPLVSILATKNKISKSQTSDQDRRLSTTPDLAFPSK